MSREATMTIMDALNEAAETRGEESFEGYRPLLFSIAYRMLGTAAEAEDAVQEAYVRYRSGSEQEIRSLKAYLVTITTRLCLDQLKAARKQREQYIGPWLPEPVITAEGDAMSSPEGRVDVWDSISMAFLLLLERLSPMERAVFLLHEVFDYSYAEIAEMVGRSEAACRQSGHRAKARVTAGRPRFSSSKPEQRRLTESFMAAAVTGDVDQFVSLLADDVVLYSDGGGKAAAALNPIQGAGAVGRFFVGVAKKGLFDHVSQIEVNGCPALLFSTGGVADTLIVVESGDGLVQRILVVRNPDKLARIMPPV